MPDSTQPLQQVQQTTPFGSTNWTNNNVTTSYDPRLLEDFWSQVDQRQGQRNVYGTAMQGAYNAMTGPGADPRAGLPGLQSGVTPGSVMTGFDRGGFARIPGAQDFGGERQRVENSLYDRFASRADTQWNDRQRGLEGQLRDQGLVPGTEAYSNAMRDLNFGRNDAYQAAAREAVAGGGAEQSRMLADALRIRGVQGAEGQQDVQNFNAGNAQSFGQRLQAGQFGNQARGQGFNENVGAQSIPMEWLRTAQGALPQGTMLPQFDVGLRGLDDQQASQNARTAWLGQLLPMLTGGGGSGGGALGGLGGLIGQLGPQAANWISGMLSPNQANWGDGSNPDWGMGSGDTDWVDPYAGSDYLGMDWGTPDNPLFG